MSHTVLDSVAMAYQPVWNRRRLLAAVRLSVLPTDPASVDAAHLMQVLGDDWPVNAPVLVLALDSPDLLQQALRCAPVPNTWLEVPAVLFEHPESLAMLSQATRRGHTLLRRGDLAGMRREFVAPLDARSLLHLSAEDALEALRSRPVEGQPMPPHPTPIRPGQIYRNVCNRGLADHCLDEAGAWGILGWPDDDVLYAGRHLPPACDEIVIRLLRQALDQDASIERIERYVRQDPVLVYRLLARVNSAAYGGRHEIDSLRHAIMMFGFSALDRWLVDQLAGADTDLAMHPVRYGLVMRARLAQHLLDPGSEEELRAEVYTTAIFAQLDRLMHEPLANLIDRLPLNDRVAEALISHAGPYHPLLDIARAQGEADSIQALPGICEQHEVSLEHANRALLRMLATSRDHGLAPEPAAPLRGV
ncbi:HDOD domain-containing protein [Hydrogenophaga sp. MI9]|uniref:HDOD domain-containing protein n=1 Tax=Hydrogenophaga sp. MI9 TaxID=3453719 RepID=UPI003EE9F079